MATAPSPRGPMDRGGDSTSLFAQPHPWLPRVASFDLLASAPAPSPSPSSSDAHSRGNAAHALDLVAPRWHAPTPGTDLNKPPRDTADPPAAGFVAPWQPYRLFPTHQPPRGRGTAPPDFVATADNLKALLQMPWTNQPVSLAVHRCGTTLLLDDVNERQANAVYESLGGPGLVPPWMPGAPRPRDPGGERDSISPRRRPPPGFPADYSRLRRPSIDRWDGGGGRSSGTAHDRPRGPVGSYAAAVHSPIGPPRVVSPSVPRESQAALEAKLLYHSLSVEAGLGRLDIREGTEGAEGAEGAEEDEDEEDERRMRRPPAVIHLPPPPPKSTAPTGALQLRGAARAVADAMVSSARNACGGDEDEEGGSAGGGTSGGCYTPGDVPPGDRAFGKPHLFEWEVHGHRLLVESSLAVFRREGRTPMSLKLVDLDAERPNTGAALSTWLDNAIAGVPELAVCYHRGGLIHHYDVLQTDDIAALCAPRFDPDVILAYAARVLEFLQHHCADDGSQYWLLGDGSAEGGLHLYDVTKGIVAASVGDERPGAGTTGGAEGAEGAEGADDKGGDDGGRALPAPRPVRLPWVDPAGTPDVPTDDDDDDNRLASRARQDNAGGSASSSSSIHSIHSINSINSSEGGGRRQPPGVAGAAGRYALLERVASVLSPSAHPAMFSAYKEELAAACLAGVSDIHPSRSESVNSATKAAAGDGEGDGEGDGGWSWEPAANFADVSSGLTFATGDLTPGVGPGLARKALGHLAEAHAALTAALNSASTPRECDEETHRRLRASLGGVLAARVACKLGVARAMHRAGRLGRALAVAESAAVDVSRRVVVLGGSASKGSPDGGGGDRGAAEKGKHIAAACAAGLGDVHAALGERVSGEGGADAAAHEKREWEAMRGTLERAGEPNGGAEGADEGAEGADSPTAAGFGPGMGHPSPGEFLGRGPGDAAGHASAAEAWYASAAMDGTFDASDASSAAGIWRRYGALRNERGKAALREAAEMSSGGDGEKAAADFVLQCAETCYADASTAFEKAKDRVNAALVGLNRAQACRARAAWNLPRAVATSPRLIEAEPDPRGRGRENDDRWRLREFEAAAGHCRRALQSLQPAAGSDRGGGRRRGNGNDRRGGEPPPAVVSAVRSELGNAALAAGLELRRLGDVPGAITRMEEAVRVLQAPPVDRSHIAVASLSAAHYHLGSLLADAALAREDGAGVASFGSVSGSHDGGNKFLPAQRHLERALAGFPPTTAPLDHARLRLRLAALADATGEGVVRGGGGGAAGVGHRESAVAHLLRAGAAFGSAPPGLDGERGWTEARKETEELLLAVLKNLVQCSVGGKRHGVHRELYSRALRGFGGSLRDFASGLGELEEAARLAHVIR